MHREGPHWDEQMGTRETLAGQELQHHLAEDSQSRGPFIAFTIWCQMDLSLRPETLQPGITTTRGISMLEI